MRRRRDIQLTGNVHVTAQPVTRTPVAEGGEPAGAPELVGFLMVATECDEQNAPRKRGKTARVHFEVGTAQLFAASILDYLERAQAASSAPGLEVVKAMPDALKGRTDARRRRRG